MNKIIKIIKEAQNVIKDNKEEWEKRYDVYAVVFRGNKDNINKLSNKFREFPPLRFYISTSKLKDAKTTLTLDVRYRGQSIATLKAKDENVTLSTIGKEINNKKHFNCDKELLDNTDWKSKEAKAFRKFFKDRNDPRVGKRNEEHNVEQLLLTEFFNESGKLKPIKGIQPVTIFGNRYGMPTPIKACEHREQPKYSGHRGGGIDILARTGRGKNGRLTVIEVKDENKRNEPPIDALKQAIQYAVFIRELLRSDCGDKWYEIFGFKGKVPKSLTIRVACAMPNDIPDTYFAGKRYPIDNDFIECHYIYFKYAKNELSDFQTSLK